MSRPHANEFGQLIGPPLPDWRPPPAPSRTEMHGRFCRLVPLTEMLADDLFDAIALDDIALDDDDRSWTYLPYGPFATREAYREWVTAAAASDDPLFFAIVSTQTKKAVGVAAYLRIVPVGGSIEVGHLFFSQRLKRTPAATEAMFLMMARAFELGYRRYEWKCDALNSPSRVAAERLGFAFEGIFRSATVYKNRSRDTAWYSIIDTEWPHLSRMFRTWLSPDNFDEEGQQRTALSALTRTVRAPGRGSDLAPCP